MTTKFRGDRRYAVLVDVGSEWPEVVFVGSNFERATELVRELDDRDVSTSTQAVVTVDEILEAVA